MSIRSRFALILAILWLWPGSLIAQSQVLMEAYRQGQTLYEVGRYEQAIPLWRKALELGEWIGFYNTERPHSSLDGQTPAEAYSAGLPVDMMDKPDGLPTHPHRLNSNKRMS